MHPYVHCSSIYNNLDMEATEMSYQWVRFFVLLMVFFAMQKPFSLMEARLLIFAFVATLKKKSIATTDIEEFTILLLLGVLWFGVLCSSF